AADDSRHAHPGHISTPFPVGPGDRREEPADHRPRVVATMPLGDRRRPHALRLLRARFGIGPVHQERYASVSHGPSSPLKNAMLSDGMRRGGIAISAPF